METIHNTTISKSEKMKNWLKKIGVAGFMFFLVKGLVWVAVFLGVGQYFN